MTKVELLFFVGCPNHVAAREVLQSVISRVAPGLAIDEIDASDPSIATALRFPGSPTIRVDGTDIEPGFVDPGDYSPRCRVFWTPDGLRGTPPRSWIEDALRRATP